VKREVVIIEEVFNLTPTPNEYLLRIFVPKTLVLVMVWGVKRPINLWASKLKLVGDFLQMGILDKFTCLGYTSGLSFIFVYEGYLPTD